MNEIEKKQIEELARDIGIAFQLSGTTRFGAVAEILVEQGYRNCKDKVVLSKEEHIALINEFNALQHKYNEICDRYRLCKDENETIKQHAVMTRKEMQEELRQASELNTENIKLEQQSTARDIINYVRYSFIHNRREFLKDLEELAKQYGVEV